MRYHNITKDDMLNGEGLRVVLWVSGCDHRCRNCQNPVTWDPKSGRPFGIEEIKELMTELKKPYINGITFSGGDPLHVANRNIVRSLCEVLKTKFPTKTIWVYTGYLYEDLLKYSKGLLELVDVLVDGPFVEELQSVSYPWAGSTNQRVIDVQKSLKEKRVVLFAGS